MKRNSLRIVCNPYNGHISFFFLNDKGIWTVLSRDSPLSRIDYKRTTLEERSGDIALIINEIYNRNNRGVDIIFEGTIQNYEYIKNAFDAYLPQRDIKCTLGISKIAVVGKRDVGKTCLIEGMENLQGFKYSINEYPEYLLYRDERNHAEWYEINRIGLGKESKERTFRTIEDLSKMGISTIVYCVSAIIGAFEESERDFVIRLVKSFPSITVLLVLTRCERTGYRELIDEMEKMTDQIKIISTLAKPVNLGIEDEDTGEEICIKKKPFGLDTLFKYIFERR